MILTLTPNQERSIKAISERKQKTVEAVLDELLTAEQPEEQEAQVDESWITTIERWEERFRDRLLPNLPLEAFSRGSLYGER